MANKSSRFAESFLLFSKSIFITLFFFLSLPFHSLPFHSTAAFAAKHATKESERASDSSKQMPEEMQMELNVVFYLN